MPGLTIASATVTVLVLLGGWFLAASPAQARVRVQAPGNVTLQLFPVPLRLAAGGSADLLAVVNNGSSDKLTDLDVGAMGPDLTVIKTESGAATVPAGEGSTFRLTVSSKGPGVLPQQLIVFAHYRAAGGAHTATVAAVDVQRQPVDGVDRYASLDVVSGLGRLDDDHSGNVYLVVHNLTSAPLQIAEIQQSAPDVVRFTRQAVDAACPAPAKTPNPDPVNCSVPARGVLLIPYRVSAHGADTDGSGLLVFSVHVQVAGQSGSDLALVGSQQVTVGRNALITLTLSDLLILVAVAAVLVIGVAAAFLRHRPRVASRARVDQ